MTDKEKLVPTEYFLSRGAHPTATDGRCAMEWVAYLAGEKHSDSPVCVSRFLQRFGIALNDRLDDEYRQRLRPYLARMIGTADDGRDLERQQLVIAWLVCEETPRFFAAAGAMELAEQLRAMPAWLAFPDARRVLVVARNEAYALRRQARATLRKKCVIAADAAYAADGGGVDDVASATNAAAVALAYATVGGDAVDVATDTVADVAYVAAATAADPSARYGGANKVRAAVDEKLKGLCEESMRSVLDLLNRMLPTEVLQMPVAQDAKAVCAIA